MAHPAELPSFEDAHRDLAARPRPIGQPFQGRELDHRLANSLQLATDFLLFEQVRIADPAARAALGEAAARLSAVGQMHRFLSAHGETAAVEFEPFLAHLGGFIAGATGLRCTVDSDPLTLKGETAQQLAIMINELAINAAKHAYRPGEAGAFHIQARTGGGQLRIRVADEGPGLRRAFGVAHAKGLGMTIVRAIARQLGAKLDMAHDDGAVFMLSVPLPQAPRINRSFAPPDQAG